MIHIIEKTLEIEGLKEPKDALVITDTHLTLADERENEYGLELQAERSRMFPNGYKGFEEIKEYVKKTSPDVVIGCGDIVDFPSHKNLEYIDDFFNNYCKEYVYAFGNHDWNYPKTYNSIYNWRGNVPKFNKVLKNGNPYVQVVDLGGVLIVAVDTNTDKIFPETIAQLKEVGKQGKPMILAMHCGFYTPKTAELVMDVQSRNMLLVVGVPDEEEEKVKYCKTCMRDENSDEFIRMMYDPEFPVVASFYGHVHCEFKEKDYISVDEYMPGRYQFGCRISCPQLTPEPTIVRVHMVPKQ